MSCDRYWVELSRDVPERGNTGSRKRLRYPRVHVRAGLSTTHLLGVSTVVLGRPFVSRRGGRSPVKVLHRRHKVPCTVVLTWWQRMLSLELQRKTITMTE